MVLIMKRYSCLTTHSFVLLLTLSTSACATDLMQVYRQAMKEDQTFAQAESTWHSQQMNLPIARANYLPQVGLIGNGNRVYTRSIPGSLSAFSGSSNGYTWQYGYTLSATQPLFDLPAWDAIKNADATVKSATATYIAAEQSLMQRTATAYFNVLEAYDQLRYTLENKRAVWQQYKTARAQFRVGLIAVTNEYNARAQYDQVVAQQIAQQNNLNIQIEALRVITDKQYASLAGLGKHMPLLSPQPNNINQWVAVADQQNYNIKAQNYAVVAAMETIKQQSTEDLPTIGLSGSYAQAVTSDNPPASLLPNTTQLDTGSYGLALSFKPIQGGAVIANTRQAEYNYATAAGLLEQTHRTVIQQTRTSFLSILSNVSQIKADRQSILSARNSAKAMIAGMQVGTRTMVDVLSALTTLYQAEEQYATDEYSYINNIIALKAAAGTLCVQDLQQINAWLGKSVHFPNQLSVANIPTQVRDNGVEKAAKLYEKNVMTPILPVRELIKKGVGDQGSGIGKTVPPTPTQNQTPASTPTVTAPGPTAMLTPPAIKSQFLPPPART